MDVRSLFAKLLQTGTAVFLFSTAGASTEAQSDTTRPTVSITSPAARTLLSGTITIAVNAVDNSGTVAAVQFLVDGQVVAEDTTAPFAVAWDTTTVAHAEGSPHTSHALTAVARDGAGNSATSAVVAIYVANDSGTVIRLEDTDPTIAYSGDWTPGDTTRAWSGGTAARGRFWMDETGLVTTALLRFTGTGVRWIGMRGPQMGRARVYLDSQRTELTAHAPDETVGAVLFSVTGLAASGHTLRIETAVSCCGSGNTTIVDAIDVMTSGGSWDTPPPPVTFAPGDIVVSLWTGEVQWRRPDGSLFRILPGAIPGTAAGMRFDPQGKLHVTRWRPEDSPDSGGNTVEAFSGLGESLSTFGDNYDCDPSAIAFDSAGVAYVGQAGCSGAIVKLTPGQPPQALDVTPENQGSFWIDLAPDGCTLFYTSWGPAVKRFDACSGAQLPDFNAAPLPGGVAQDLRVLPDGGVLVSSGEVIARLDSSGTLVQTYEVPGEHSPWAGLELVGDGTFWCANYESSNVYRFALSSGAVVGAFNTGTPPHTVIGLTIKK